MKISLRNQIEEVEHEIALREVAYKRLDTTKPRGKAERDLHLMRMRAVLKTLKVLEANREAVLTVINVEHEQSEIRPEADAP